MVGGKNELAALEIKANLCQECVVNADGASHREQSDSYRPAHILAVSGAHFVHDTYTAFVAPLLPLIIERLSLSLMAAGSLTLYLQLPSVLNPLIGYLDDRMNLRRLVALAPAVTATLMTCIGLVSNYWSLAFLFLLTGCSMALFHAPAPAMIARVAAGRVGMGMSLFMAAGELGRTVGPLIAVWAVSVWTLDGIWRIALVGWVASAFLYVRVGAISPSRGGGFSLRGLVSVAWRLFLPLFLIVFARGFLISSIGVYLPTFLEGRGASLWVAAGALSIYEFAGVAGALSSGTLSDRIGRRPVLFVAMFASSLLLFGFVKAEGWLLIPILIALGMASLSAQPVMLAIVQDNLPQHRSLASGLHLGMSFVLRPVAAIVIGMMGDRFGLETAIVVCAVIVLLATPLVLALPRANQ